MNTLRVASDIHHISEAASSADRWSVVDLAPFTSGDVYHSAVDDSICTSCLAGETGGDRALR